MGKRDLKSITDHATLFAKVAVTATQTIQGSEVAGFDGAKFVIDIGAWTADDLKVTMQDSDDNSVWADIADANLEGSANNVMIVTGIASTYIQVGYTGNKRYIGAKITDTGTGSAVVGVYVTKGFPKQVPV